MARHTPGPWRVEDGTTLVWGNCTFSDDGTVDRLGVPVAEMCANPSWARGTEIDWDTRVANAALTAAAPDLAEHVRALTRQLDAVSVYISDPKCRVVTDRKIAEARAALASAGVEE